MEMSKKWKITTSLVLILSISIGLIWYNVRPVYSENYSSKYVKVRLQNPIKSKISVNLSSSNGFLVGKMGTSFEKILDISHNSIVVKNGTNSTSIVIQTPQGETLYTFNSSDNIYIGTPSGIVKVESSNYRGYITFNRTASELVVVNYLTLDQYLYGVVPREMSPSWHKEALKAQAISARTFALLNLGKHSAEGYNLCDQTHCQAYAGYDREHVNSNSAVNETVNQVIKYNGKLASVYFFASSGGHTASNEDIWNGTPIPYLRGIKDDFSLGSPYDNWTYTISKNDFKQKLIANGLDVGDIISISITKTSAQSGGRVIELSVSGTKGTKVLLREKIRAVLGYNNIKSTLYTAKMDGQIQNGVDTYATIGSSNQSSKINLKGATVRNSLASSNLSSSLSNVWVASGSGTQNVQIASTGTTGDNITFEGKGWGHGIGMSQYGAKKMGEMGYNYKQILEHYYNGAKVE